MSSNRLKIEVNALTEGMFVSDLDCPWHHTPFPLQGFYIRSDDDLKALSGYCKHVYIDVKRDRTKHAYTRHSARAAKNTGKILSENTMDQEAKLLKLPPLVIKSPKHYDVKVSINKEVTKATRLHKHVYEAIGDVFSTVHAGGHVSIKETEHVAEEMVESVTRNPDALVWLAKMNEADALGYRHSVNASIWALVFGRHLGLDKPMLKTLAMGVLMSHVGKTRLSADLLVAPSALSGEALEAYRSYVFYSTEILENIESIPSGVVAIARFHQERHNGTGFPQGLTGEKIPLLAKIAGLVDFYQELITPLDGAKGISPLDAVSTLYELRNVTFQQDLVERFIEAVGVYPTGTLVELSSQEVGIVTGHNLDRRLFPKVMIVLDQHKQPLKNGKVIDLKERNMRGNGTGILYIADSLPKGAYNIDETAYLLTGAKSRWSWKHIAGTLAAS